eukprot:4451301-Heterocapsa_arctica.AAC.1
MEEAKEVIAEELRIDQHIRFAENEIRHEQQDQCGNGLRPERPRRKSVFQVLQEMRYQRHGKLLPQHE